jgi:hypothetical protein
VQNRYWHSHPCTFDRSVLVKHLLSSIGQLPRRSGALACHFDPRSFASTSTNCGQLTPALFAHNGCLQPSQHQCLGAWNHQNKKQLVHWEKDVEKHLQGRKRLLFTLTRALRVSKTHPHSGFQPCVPPGGVLRHLARLRGRLASRRLQPVQAMHSPDAVELKCGTPASDDGAGAVPPATTPPARKARNGITTRRKDIVIIVLLSVLHISGWNDKEVVHLGVQPRLLRTQGPRWKLL